MRFETEMRDGVCVIRLQGRFVTGSDGELASVQNHLQEIGAASAVLDFREVPYIDSTGLAFVVELHKAMKQRGGQAVVAEASPRIREVLNLTRIAEVVPVYDSLETAETALRGAAVC